MSAVEKKQYFAYRSFWPEIEAMKKFRECGVDTFMFMVSNITNSLGTPYTKYPPVWKWNGIYDLDAFDRQIGDILEAVPDAKLMCMIDLNTPQWWTRYLGAFGVKYDTFYELGKISASPMWRRDTADYMRTVLEHAENKYAKNITAYLLGCGGATEWHDRSRGEESVYRLAAFRQWQKEQGKTQTDIPTRMARDSGSYDFDPTYVTHENYYNGIDPTGCYAGLFPDGAGLIRTPEKDQSSLDYWRFCNEFNADTASFFLEKARQTIRSEAELGMFFGYGTGQWTLVSSGHVAYERLLDSPDLDFIMAPIDYVGRGMGQGSTSMTVKETIHIKGKRMLQEMDQRTYTANRKLADYCELPDPLKTKADRVVMNDSTDSKELAKKFSMATDGVWKNDAEIVAGMKRDTAFCLINQDSLWWFDMWGGFYQGEKVFKSLAQLKRIWDEQVHRPGKDVNEILMVKDPHNMYLLNDMDARCGTFDIKPLNALSVTGMPYTVCSFNDLSSMDLRRFKLIIFCHPFELTHAHRDLLDAKVLKDGRTVIWLYGPGIVNQGSWDPGNVEKTCGTPYKTHGINRVEKNGWISVYVHDPSILTADALKATAEKAGCHSYCSKLRPICANDRLLSVHTAIAETMEIKLRRKTGKITELFSGAIWCQTDQVRLTSTGPDSFLLLMEN
ncbi:MAG: hypothetical protein WCS96_03275 [Victivallales bacterium]